MDGFQEQGYAQLTWTYGTPASPIPAFTTTIPDENPKQSPKTGWQWTQCAIRGDQLGSWEIVRNGVKQSHTGTRNLGGSSQASWTFPVCNEIKQLNSMVHEIFGKNCIIVMDPKNFPVILQQSFGKSLTCHLHYSGKLGNNKLKLEILSCDYRMISGCFGHQAGNQP
jgi:hypothetical protein